ncbi:hypothetical protein CCR75_001903 [Bremia lactucae]|uniref:Phosphatidylinositol 3-kinase n=1 Tax=Bremia lactucae TaxID=4779 RepID=A0A976FHP0_BRELC|nr:hypothetical protein CCR75_001903 [Bremia lactucae]
MYEKDSLRDAGNVDLSFSQILEVRSTLQRRRQTSVVAETQLSRPVNPFPRQNASQSYSSIEANCDKEDKGPPAYGMLDSVYEGSEDILEESADDIRRGSLQHCIDSSRTEDQDWINRDDGHVGPDMYRFVQPRRLSSWVQDDAVFACFKCHTVFSLLIRKHHCRACGRIFCSVCSSQRVIIPGDYEVTPVSPTYNSLTTNATDLIGNISWYLTSYSTPDTVAELEMRTSSALTDSETFTPAIQHETFLKDVQRLQELKIISNFTPNRSKSASSLSNASASTTQSSMPRPDGSVLQRVCDDCACALQQRRRHYNTVKVFELCAFNLQELRTLGQVCRKWHRATIMCLSMFRQIQYYLPTHRLSEREKNLLIINRHFLGGHTKWLLQLVKAIDFSAENEWFERKGQTGFFPTHRDTTNPHLIHEVLNLLTQERKYTCMLTMCSRLCKPQIGSVDALEILADDTIYNDQLRGMAVNALLKTATENEWWSYLHVLLHSLSVETNATGSKLGQSLIRQAQCDIRFCYELYWGLTVMAEDPSCRRKFDGMKQRLLLTLSHFQDNSSTGRQNESSHQGTRDDVAEQLLQGQELVDLLWKIPPRIPVEDARRFLEASIQKSSFGTPHPIDLKKEWRGLRLPVDPHVKVRGIQYQKLEVKRSAEAPMIITCTGVDRTEEDAEEAADATIKSQRNTWSRRTHTLPHYRLMYKRDDLRKDSIVQNIINVMYLILKQETKLEIPLVTYRVLPTSSFDGFIEIVENAHTLYAIIRDHGSILNFLHHYNGHRTLSDISSSFRESLAAYIVITFLLGVGDRHADNVMLTKDGILFHIDYGFILGKDPKPLQPPMRLDHYMIEALGGTLTPQFEQFKQLCVIAFNCLRRHVSLFMIMLTLVVKALPEITDFGVNYTQSDLEAFVIERFLPGQSDDEAATALMLRMEGKLNERIGLKLSDFVHAHANEKTVSKGMTSVGSSVKIGVEAVEATVSTVASSLTSSASTIYKYMWGGPHR